MSIVSLNATALEIERVLESDVRPMLAMHRGSVEFVSYENNIVSLRLQGTCRGCPLSQLTLKAGIETILKDTFPDIERVEAVD